jgi:hypothetical protein
MKHHSRQLGTGAAKERVRARVNPDDRPHVFPRRPEARAARPEVRATDEAVPDSRRGGVRAFPADGCSADGLDGVALNPWKSALLSRISRAYRET